MLKTLLYDDVKMNHINNLSICWGKDRISFRGLAPSRFYVCYMIGTGLYSHFIIVIYVLFVIGYTLDQYCNFLFSIHITRTIYKKLISSSMFLINKNIRLMSKISYDLNEQHPLSKTKLKNNIY
jgi:hypothetical protein